MSETLADQVRDLQDILGEVDHDRVDALADEVGALEAKAKAWEVATYRTEKARKAEYAESEGLKAEIEALAEQLRDREGDLWHECNANKALWDVLRAKIAKFQDALRATTDALGDHCCGVCGNADKNTFDDDQPYSDVTDPETETCSGCRVNYAAYRAGIEVLDD